MFVFGSPCLHGQPARQPASSLLYQAAMTGLAVHQLAHKAAPPAPAGLSRILYVRLPRVDLGRRWVIEFGAAMPGGLWVLAAQAVAGLFGIAIL